jgi:lipoprotein-releasing system permease protein
MKNKTIIWLLIKRFLMDRGGNKSMAVMIWVCVISIGLSAGALTLVGAIMRGFEVQTQKALQGVHADILVTATDGFLNEPLVHNMVNTEYKDKIANISFWNTTPVMVSVQQADRDAMMMGTFIGIDPVSYKQVSTIPQRCVDPIIWEQLGHKSGVIMGKGLATSLNLAVGDQCMVGYRVDGEHDAITLNQKKVTVLGMFDTGIDEWDSGMMIGNRLFFKDILGGAQARYASVTVVRDTQPTVIAAQLQKRFAAAPVSVATWDQLYPALVSAFALEKYAMVLIFLLMMLIACCVLIALLFMMLTYKKYQIAVLFSVGMSRHELMLIFLAIGLSISMVAAGIGVMIACGLGYGLQTYHWVSLPHAYYVEYLPAELSWSLPVMVLASVAGIATAVISIPLYFFSDYFSDTSILS